MSLVSEFSESPDFGAAVSTLSRRWPKAARWLVIDEAGNAEWLQMASWRTGGYHRQPILTLAASLMQEADGVLLIAQSAKHFSPSLLELLDEGWRMDVPSATIFAPPGAPPSLSIGGTIELFDDRGPIDPEPVLLELRGDRPIRLRTTLPVTMEVASTHVSAVVECAVAGAPSSRFRISAQDGDPIGSCPLTLDAVGHPAANGLAFQAAKRVRVERLPSRTQERRPIRLHLIIDRSTVDTESWGQAFSLASGWPVENWAALNAKWREQLADGLERGVLTARTDTTVLLYWFADRRREEGIALPVSVPAVSEVAAGRVGAVSGGLLRQTISGASFDYLSGLDLYDAVDEGLAAVRAAISSAGGANEDIAVIVGDSPPPPAGTDDPVWRIVTNGGTDAAGGTGTRSNARRSPLFTESLRALRAARVPVGWLFLRDGRDVVGEPLLRGHHVGFRALRERILEAITEFDGLTVEPCDDLSRIGDCLTTLIDRMLELPDGLPWARVRLAPTEIAR
jgi:hypothetical protein